MIATLFRLAGINANVKYEICSWQSGQKNTSWIAPGGGEHIYIYIIIYIYIFFMTYQQQNDKFRKKKNNPWLFHLDNTKATTSWTQLSQKLVPASHFTMPLTCCTPCTSLGRPQLNKASNASTAKLRANELLHAASNGAGRAIAIKVSPFLKQTSWSCLAVC